MNARPTVFIVDDDSAMRDSLGFLIGPWARGRDLHVAEEFLDAYTTSARVHRPRRADARTLRLELMEKLGEGQFAPPVVLITEHGDIPMAVRALKAGAFGHREAVRRPGPAGDQQALQQDTSIVPPSTSIGHRTARRPLTTRENQVFELVVDGKPNKVVASELGLSQKTVEVHRAHVMEKMRAESFADLVKMAVVLEVTGPPKSVE